MPKLHRTAGYIRERLRDPAALRHAGYRFRTILAGKHRAIVAWAPQAGRGPVLQAILHPRSEARGKGAKFICHGEQCRRIKENYE